MKNTLFCFGLTAERDSSSGRKLYRTDCSAHPLLEPRFGLACLLIPDDDVRALYEDLAAALDVAAYLARSGREVIAESLVHAIHQAFRSTLLPRGDTEEYLSRIAAAADNRPADDFYGNEERLGSLWERWKFRLPAGSLTPQQRLQTTRNKGRICQGTGFRESPFPGRRKYLVDRPCASRPGLAVAVGGNEAKSPTDVSLRGRTDGELPGAAFQSIKRSSLLLDRARRSRAFRKNTDSRPRGPVGHRRRHVG